MNFPSITDVINLTIGVGSALLITLCGFRAIGPKPGVVTQFDAMHKNGLKHLRWLGPIMLAAVIKSAFGQIPMSESEFFLALGLYFITPIWFAVWLIHQHLQKTSLAPAIRCLKFWFGSFIILLAIFFSGIWYGENSSRAEQIVSHVIATALFVATPLTLLFYLHWQEARRQPTA